MTTVTVELPFAVTREHELLLRAAERKLSVLTVMEVGRPGIEKVEDWPTMMDLISNLCIGLWPQRSGLPLHLPPLGRAILEQCPSLWDPADLEAKLREMES